MRIVDAIEVKPSATIFEEIERFVGGDAEFREGHIVVATREGALHIQTGDWLVKTLDGKFHALNPETWSQIQRSAEREGR